MNLPKCIVEFNYETSCEPVYIKMSVYIYLYRAPRPKR